MHVNCSLAKDGKNAFYDPDAPLQLSETCMHFIGGLLRHAPAITRVANPTINSYKRLVPGYEAPCYVSWSTSNRSALVRVPAPRGNSTRVEFRSPDPTCNPYLTFAAMLTAGMEGVRKEIEPPAGANGNIFHMTTAERERDGIGTLPGSLAEAHRDLLADDLICRAFGPHVVDALTRAEAVRLTAAEALGTVGDERALDPLERLKFSDSNVGVRRAASLAHARAVGRLAEKKAVEGWLLDT
ncbi:MAG: Glutamine synthetase [Methanoculleus marisnigri]|uniref:Glutamine synthetase n=1 Tax=Methanoculleus marisnigri TaxID=2198 RepID=A0A101GRG6_9EURY|nr:MAG: Glutamine synthetase [Methanoculleus marisnigri]